MVKQIVYKGLTITYRKGLANVSFGGRWWEFDTLKQAKSFCDSVA